MGREGAPTAMKPSLFLKLAPERRLVLSYVMQQALHILQMPQIDLGQWLLEEIEKNPLLEIDSYKRSAAPDPEIPSPISFYDHLLSQLRYTFSDKQERKIAYKFLGELDERGFLPEELLVKGPAAKILTIMQSFEPPGIFARNLKECLLIQLKRQGKHFTYQLVDQCFEDLLHARFTLIRKKFGKVDFAAVIHDLARLNLRPSHSFGREPLFPIYIDLKITKVQGGWSLELVEDELPTFHIKDEYLNLKPESTEEHLALRDFKTQAKWIFRSLQRRRKLLKELGKLLLSKQCAFLEAKGPLKALGMKEIAEKLGIHESTLSRAVAGKYAATPRGILPIRGLITKTPEALDARSTLEKLVETENKEHPLTDQELAHKLKEKGYPIARRTIAKYRTQLKIGSATQRKYL